LAEIGGAYLIWKAFKGDGGVGLAILGALALTGYGILASLQTDPHFGRVLAAYGGVFVAGSLLWAIALDGFRPQATDLLGAAVCLFGALIIVIGSYG
jgi:small multidrug resistance family-3 protein